MDIANAFIIVGSLLGIIVIGAMAILPSLWEYDAARPDRPSRRPAPPVPLDRSPESRNRVPASPVRQRRDLDRAA